jgi:hypothetical protein
MKRCIKARIDLGCQLRRHAQLLLVIVALTGVVAVAAGQDLTFLQRTLQEYDYQLYVPPRANWGPGFVFAGDVVKGRMKNVEPVCPSLYENVGLPESTAVILPDFKAEDRYSFSLAIDFLRGLFGGRVDLGAVERDRKVEVRWHNLQEMSYPKMVAWLKNGEPRPITKPCRAAIEDLKIKNQFKDRVFVIVRAVAPETLVYDFTRALSSDAAVSGQFAETWKAEARGKGQIVSETQLEIKHRLYIGYAAPVKIVDWLPSGLQSGDIVAVLGARENITIEE